MDNYTSERDNIAEKIQAFVSYADSAHKGSKEHHLATILDRYDHFSFLSIPRPMRVIRCKLEIGIDINTIINMYVKDKFFAISGEGDVVCGMFGLLSLSYLLEKNNGNLFLNLGERMRLSYDESAYNDLSPQIKNAFNYTMDNIAKILSGWKHINCEWKQGVYKRRIDYNLCGEKMSVEKEEFYFGKLVIECSHCDIPDLINFFDKELGTDILYPLNAKMIKIYNPYGYYHRGYKDLQVLEASENKDLPENDLIELDDNSLSISLVKPYVDSPKFNPWQTMWYVRN